jgi:xylulokinase
MSHRSLLASIDFGTTGVRVLIVDSEGNTLGTGACSVKILPTSAGTSEQTLDDFWDALLVAWQDAVEKARISTKNILAVGVSHQRCTFALADQDGKPISNLIVWMDRRGIPYLQQVHDLIGLKKYYEITGLPIYYISSLSKILWFRHQAEELFRATSHIWPIANFIFARMGVLDAPIDEATGSFYGLMDTRQRSWANNLTDDLDLDITKLPELVHPASVVGKLTDRTASEAFGLLLGTPLVIGGGDQQCAALGSGMIRVGQSIINLGTATALMAAVSEPVRDPNYTIPCVCHAAPGLWEMEGHTQASGIILQRFRDEFAQHEARVASQLDEDIYDYLMHFASLSTPGAAGLLLLPMFNGSTAPVNDPYSSGVLIGLRLSHTRNDILRAILEGICMENRWIIESMIQSGAAVNDIYITGGASKSDFWNQLQANILKRPITRLQTSNAALIGAAICAGLGIGIFSTIEEGLDRYHRTGTRYLPKEQTAVAYDQLYAEFIQTYTTLGNSEVFKNLRSIGENQVP